MLCTKATDFTYCWTLRFNFNKGVNVKEALGITGIVVLLVILIGLGPILTLMSINTLFGLNIAINFWTWLSVVWLGIVLNGTRVKSK